MPAFQCERLKMCGKLVSEAEKNSFVIPLGNTFTENRYLTFIAKGHSGVKMGQVCFAHSFALEPRLGNLLLRIKRSPYGFCWKPAQLCDLFCYSLNLLSPLRLIGGRSMKFTIASENEVRTTHFPFAVEGEHQNIDTQGCLKAVKPFFIYANTYQEYMKCCSTIPETHCRAIY